MDGQVDLNFYRKISKYDLDRLTVDWNKLRREKKLQTRLNG